MPKPFDLQDIISTMTALGVRFPVFCNETDFKHRFASLVEGTCQGQHVRAYMEYRYNEMGNAKKYFDQKGRAIEMHSDITVYLGGEKTPIEFKYRTKGPSRYNDYDDGFGKMKVRDCDDRTNARYEFIEDIYRLEDLIANSNQVDVGYAIFLTNDSDFWTNKKKGVAIDFQFPEIPSSNGGPYVINRAGMPLTWGTPNVKQPIILKGRYPVMWYDYASNISWVCPGIMRYTVIEVKKTMAHGVQISPNNVKGKPILTYAQEEKTNDIHKKKSARDEGGKLLTYLSLTLE